MPIQLAKQNEVIDLLGGLLGRSLQSGKGSEDDLSGASSGAVAIYRSGDDLAGICYCDLQISNGAGAALSLVPMGVAQDGIDKGVIEDNLLDNLKEVLNIASQWFHDSSEKSVKFEDVMVLPCDLPDELKSMMSSPANRLDLEIEIPAYTKGRLSLLS